MMSHAGYAPTTPPSALKSFLDSMTLWTKIKYAGTGLFILGLLGFSALMMRKSMTNVVVFENSLDTAGELSLDGKSYGTIAPKQHVRVELEAKSYALSFSAGGKKLDEGTLAVPDKTKDMTGYRAVYNLGGKKGLAVVTKIYGGGSLKDSVRVVEEGKRVIEVPYATLDKIDDSFPDTITVNKNAKFGSIVRVCHVDEAKDSVGCPGW